MRNVLLFPAEETRLRDILRNTYQIIPINLPVDLQDYISLAEVLVVDTTKDSQQAIGLVKEVVHNRDFGIVVYIGKEDVQLEEEFLRLGTCTIIKENYSVDTIQGIINQVIQVVHGRRELIELKAGRTIESNISRTLRVPSEMMEGMLIQVTQQREVLKSFSKMFSAGYNLTMLLNIFLNVLQEILKVSRIAILLEENGVYKVKDYRGISPKVVEYISFPVGGALVGYLKREGTALRLEHLQSIESQLSFEMRSLGVATMVPLWEHGKLIGIIAFNNKITGVPVTDEELELVFALGSQVAVAIENTSLIEVTSEQRNYLESILNHVSCGVITINKENTVVTYNPKAEEILGISREQILEKHINSLPGDIAILLEENVRTGQTCFRKELRLTQFGKFIGVSITPIRTDQGDIMGSVMIFTDITPIKALEEETKRLDRLDFTSTVAMRSSHELKNCLVSIKTFAQLLPERYIDKQFREDFYLVVNNEVDRLNQLVENLLFFAQPLRLDSSSYDIEELIQETIEILEREDALTGVEIVKEFGHRLRTVDVDRDAMLRAIKGVLYNTIQAMPKGGKVRIVTCDVSKEEFRERSASTPMSIGATADKDFLELKIIDQGTGIPPELIDKVWDPFFTTKTRGIGLGLTIVRKIIETHGGSVTISSQPQKGTELSMLIPKISQSKEGNILYFPSGRKVVV